MKRAATIGLAMAMFVAGFSPAMAQGLLTDLVKDTLDITGGVVNTAGNLISGTVNAAGEIIDTSGKVVGRVVTDGTGLVVGAPTPTTTTEIVTVGPATDVYRYTIDTRTSDLRSAILAAEAQGKLTASQSAELRADLDRIAAAEAGARLSNGLTFDEAISIARDLDATNVRFGNLISITPYRPLIVEAAGTQRMVVIAPRQGGLITNLVNNPIGTSLNVVSGTVDAAGNIVGTTGGIIGRVVGGTIGAATSAIVGTPATSTTTVVETVPSTDRRVLTVGTTTEVYGRYLTNRLQDLREAILEAEARGTITSAQSLELRTDLDRIATAQAAARISGNTLTFDEAMMIAKDIDTTNNRVTGVLHTELFPSMVVVDANGVSRLSFGGRREMVSTTSGGVTTTTTTQSVTAPTTVTTTTTGTPASWLAVLEGRRFELDNMIGKALMERKITAREAADLSAQLSGIAGRVVSFRTATTPITLEQAVALAREIDTINGRVATILSVPAMPSLTVSQNGTTNLVTDEFGNVIGYSTVQPNMFVTTVDARRAQIESIISAGLAGNSLTAQQAAELRAELDRIAKLEAASTSGTQFAFTRALPIAYDLDVLGGRIHTLVPTSTYTPIITGSRMVLSNGQIVMLDDVMVRRAELEGRIAREMATGRLTTAEAARLRVQLDSIASMESRMRADGYLTYKESRLLYQSFDRVGSRLDSLVANRRGSISAR